MTLDTLSVKISRLVLSATFIISAIAKIISLAFFDDLVAKQLIGLEYYTDENSTRFFGVLIITRLLIAGELLLGIAILQKRLLKQLVIPMMGFLLVVFSLQVLNEAILNDKGFFGGNCGCFGEVIPLDNFETLVKNVLLLILLAVVHFKYKEINEMAFGPAVPSIMLGVFTFITLYLAIPGDDGSERVDFDGGELVFEQYVEDPCEDLNLKIDSLSRILDSLSIILPGSSESDQDYVENVDQASAINIQRKLDSLESVRQLKLKEQREKEEQKAKQSLFYNYQNFSGGITKNLDQGTHIICLFSLTCGHCQQAYRDILSCKKEGGDMGQIYIIGYGSETDLRNFWDVTGPESPHIRVSKISDLNMLLEGDDFPKIIVKQNGETVQTWDYDTYSKDALYKFFGVDTKAPEVPSDELEINLDSDPLLMPSGDQQIILEE